MAVESIGVLIPTKIPGYTDAADIQAALRAYHYGSYSYDPNETDPAELINPSIAYTINDLQDQIDSIGGGGLTDTLLTGKGALITATATSTPETLALGATNGFVLTINSATATGLEWASPSVTLINSVALSNKTLTAPKFVDLGFIADANGNEMVIFNTTTSSVNEITISNAATAGIPEISATGSDTNISLNLVSKGTGTVKINSVNIVDLSSTQTLTSKTLTSPIINLSVNAQTSTTYTTVLSDNGKLVTLNNASPVVVTVPTNSSVAYSTGAQINLLQLGAGQASVVGDAGVTVYSTPGLNFREQYSAATLIKLDTDTWLLTGDLST